MADESDDSKPQESEVENSSHRHNHTSPSLAFPSLNIWPPSQRTREAVTGRLVDTLTSPTSVIAKRYGVFPVDKATPAAVEIEKEAFATANQSASDEAKVESVDSGLELLEIYSKTICRRMLEMVKARNPAGNEAISPPSVASLSIDDAESHVGESAETEAPAPS